MTITQTQTGSEQSHFEKEERIMYPFPSRDAIRIREKRAEGIEVPEWHAPGVDLDEAFHAADGPVLEIGGPTRYGYYFLEGRPLHTKPIMSDIKQHDGVEQLFDARDIPFPDDSFGIILSNNIPLHDPTRNYIGPLTEKDTIADVWDIRDLAVTSARAVIERVGKEQVIDTRALQDSLRLGIAREVFRKLKPGGLYLTISEKIERDAFKALGFELLASVDLDASWNGPDPYPDELMVYRKPADVQ